MARAYEQVRLFFRFIQLLKTQFSARHIAWRKTSGRDAAKTIEKLSPDPSHQNGQYTILLPAAFCVRAS